MSDWRTMTAGRELDRILAVCLGWKLCEFIITKDDWQWSNYKSTRGRKWYVAAPYSSSSRFHDTKAAAWEDIPHFSTTEISEIHRPMLLYRDFIYKDIKSSLELCSTFLLWWASWHNGIPDDPLTAAQPTTPPERDDSDGGGDG